MFMNYMDYTDDACMNIFTNDQKNRMIAAINTSRSGLLTSDGCFNSDYGCTDPLAFNFSPKFQAVLRPCIPAPIITYLAFCGILLMI